MTKNPRGGTFSSSYGIIIIFTIRNRDSHRSVFLNLLLWVKEFVNSDCRFGFLVKNCIGGWGGESFCETANREIVSFRSCVRACERARDQRFDPAARPVVRPFELLLLSQKRAGWVVHEKSCFYTGFTRFFADNPCKTNVKTTFFADNLIKPM